MEKQNNNIPSISIEKIKFNDETSIEFKNDDIVLLVGANNVGKSRTLKDLKDDLNDLSKTKVIVDEVVYKSSDFSSSQLKDYFEKNISKDIWGNYNVFIDENHSQSFDDSSFTAIADERQFYKVLFSFLSTESRLNITRPIMFNTIVDNRSLVIMKGLESDSESIKTLNKVLQIGFEKSVDAYEEYTDGTIVIDCQFEDAKSFGQHLAAVKQDGKWGYIDQKGNVVIPCIYEDADSFQNGHAFVKTEAGWVEISLVEYS